MNQKDYEHLYEPCPGNRLKKMERALIRDKLHSIAEDVLFNIGPMEIAQLRPYIRAEGFDKFSEFQIDLMIDGCFGYVTYGTIMEKCGLKFYGKSPKVRILYSENANDNSDAGIKKIADTISRRKDMNGWKRET